MERDGWRVEGGGWRVEQGEAVFFFDFGGWEEGHGRTVKKELEDRNCVVEDP